MSSTPGRSGSRYIRDVLMPSSNSSLRARSKLALAAGAVLHRPVRGHAEALLVEPAVGVAHACRRRSRRCRRATSRTSRSTPRRPAPARRRAGGARRRRPTRACPCRRASAAHSSTAENCGRPTPVIIRVVHMAPGPTPTFTMSAPASIRSRVPRVGDDVAGHDRRRRRRAWRRRATSSMACSVRVWWPWAVSITSTSTPSVERRPWP